MYSKVIRLSKYMYLFFFKFFFPFKLLQNIEQNSLCGIVGLCWQCVHVTPQNPTISPRHISGNHKFNF